MAVYAKRSCPRCQQVIEGWTVDYRAIEPPFTQCSNCKLYIKLNHCNEWSLMKEGDKIIHILRTSYTGILYFGVPIFMVLLFTGLMEKYQNQFILIIITILIIANGISFYLLNKRISDSNERMRKPEYIKILKYLKLITD